MSKTHRVILLGEAFHGHRDFIAKTFLKVIPTTINTALEDVAQYQGLLDAEEDFEHLCMNYIVDISDEDFELTYLEKISQKIKDKSRFRNHEEQIFIYFREDGRCSASNLKKLRDSDSGKRLFFFSDMTSNHRRLELSVSLQHILQAISLDKSRDMDVRTVYTLFSTTLKLDRSFFQERGEELFYNKWRQQVIGQAKKPQVGDDFVKKIVEDLESRVQKKMLQPFGDQKGVNICFDTAPLCAYQINLNALVNLKAAEREIFVNFYRDSYERKAKLFKELFTSRREAIVEEFYSEIRSDLISTYWLETYGYGYYFINVVETFSRLLLNKKKGLEMLLETSKKEIQQELESKNYSQSIQTSDKKKKWYEFWKKEFPNFEQDLSAYLIENVYDVKLKNKFREVLIDILGMIDLRIREEFLENPNLVDYSKLLPDTELDTRDSLTITLNDLLTDLIDKKGGFGQYCDSLLSYDRLGKSAIKDDLDKVFEETIFSLSAYPKSISDLFDQVKYKDDILKQVSKELWKKSETYDLRLFAGRDLSRVESYLIGNERSPIYVEIENHLIKLEQGPRTVTKVSCLDSENIILCHLYTFDEKDLLILNK